MSLNEKGGVVVGVIVVVVVGVAGGKVAKS